MVGRDANDVLMKVLLQVTQGSLVISVTCDYVLMNQERICQGTVGQNMLRLVERDKMNLKIMGGGFFVGGVWASVSHSERPETGNAVYVSTVIESYA